MTASQGGTSLTDRRQGLVAGVPVSPAHHGHSFGSSTCRDVMTLPTQPSAVPAARARAQRVLREWRFGPRLCEDVAICLSELVTNAIQASAVLRPVAAPVYVGLARERGWLHLAVADASPRLPLRLSADDDAVCGRAGPGLVKVVWAEWAKG